MYYVVFLSLINTALAHALTSIRRAPITPIIKMAATTALPKVSTLPIKPIMPIAPITKQISQPTVTGYEDWRKGYQGSSFQQAATPLLGLGFAYNVYDQLKTYLGYMPSLNVENIEKYPQFKEQFIRYALEHFDTLDVSILRVMIQKYPDLAEKLAEELDTKFKNNKDKAQQLIQTIIPKIRTLLQSKDDLIINMLLGAKKIDDQQYLGKEVDVITISMPFLKSVFWNDSSMKRYELIDALQEAVTHKYPDFAFLPSGEAINVKTGRRSFFEIAFLRGELQKVNLIYSILNSNNDAAIDRLLEKTTDRDSFLEDLYRQSKPEVQEKLADLMHRVIARRIPNFVFLPEGIGFNPKTAHLHEKGKYPLWAYGVHKRKTKPRTQSEAHLLANPEAALCLLTKLPKEALSVFSGVHRQEIKERSKGNYVFYHGQQWRHHLSADLYKQLWNIAKHDNVGTDFTFLQFDKSYRKPLYMNQALLGYAGHSGKCTAEYFCGGSNDIMGTIPTQMIFEELGMSKYYDTYKGDIKTLEDLHRKAIANSAIFGNLLLISVPPDKVNAAVHNFKWGKPRMIKKMNGQEEHVTTKTEIDTILSEPQTLTSGSNWIEFTMPITRYVLDPHNGPKIYNFNAADPVKLREYKAARDEIFAKIKKDYEADQAAS